MSKIKSPGTSKALALFCAKVADKKLANNILILNLKSIKAAVTDYFVVCSCDSTVQVKAVADEIEYEGKMLGLQNPKIEGRDNYRWVLIDYFDVVVHIMLEDVRQYYKIERIWSDARFSLIDNEGKPSLIKHDRLVEVI